jgi:hypothetical protein
MMGKSQLPMWRGELTWTNNNNNKKNNSVKKFSFTVYVKPTRRE